MNFLLYLCFCIIFTYYGSQTTASQSAGSSEQFFKLLSEYIQNTGGYKVGSLQSGDARGLPLPLLILPVPAGYQDQNVKVQNEDTSFNLESRLRSEQESSQVNAPKGFSLNKQLHKQITVQQGIADDEFSSNSNYENSGGPQRTIIIKESSKTAKTNLPDVQQDISDDDYSDDYFDKTSGPPVPPHRTILIKEPSKTSKPIIPDTPASSKDLLRLYHAQYAHLQGENLPPAVIDKAALHVTYESRFSEQTRNYFEDDTSNLRQQQGGKYLPRNQNAPVQDGPPTPQWNFPLKMKAQLQVPRAEYTEPFQMWYNSRNGAMKIDFHEGGTETYRLPTPDGRQKKISKRTNRLGESNIAECIVASPQDIDVSTPGLPDLTNYQFGGHENSEHGTFEKWVYELQGNPGQYGASTQESLTFHHEMLVQRGARNVIPVKYSVKIDSSVLGANCDGYSYRYFDVEDLQEDDETQFNFDVDTNCQRQENGDVTNPVHRIHLEPLHEFSLPGRDERYDVEIETFKIKFERKYMDSTEEAMRKNLYIQNSRFILSGNRESATFELEMNFLGDRLAAELSLIRGVSWSADEVQGRGLNGIEDFPHPEPMIRNLAKKLPKEFDWRPRGAVSEVRWQGSCPSCWAFAVAGAVEGALFVRKQRLVPLSEQCLVDCGRPFGTHGCGGTWPRYAYDYVKARGLPARDEYGPYIEKEQSCHKKSASEPVTHISAYVNVTQRSVPALQIAIRRHSPSVVIVDAHANSFIFYKTGVLYDDRCGKTLPKLNHAVLAVGWGEHRRTPYFILKNSWSAAWGENGYIKVQGPANTCGVLEQPSYPRLEDNDVDRLPN